MKPDLEFITLKQKVPGKRKFLKEFYQEVGRTTPQDPLRIFLYYDVAKVAKLLKPIFQKLKLNVTIPQAWVHILKPDAFHTIHTHEHATGVYYLKTPENSGNIFFNDFDITIPVEEDLFILVPAKVKHSIGKNKSEKDRVAIGFAMEYKKIGS